MDIHSPSKKTLPSIVVSGDVTLNSNIALLQETSMTEPYWNRNELVSVNRQRGSALMTADLIRAVVGLDRRITDAKKLKRLVSCPQDAFPDDLNKPAHCFYSKWKWFEDETSNAWRVEEILGFDQKVFVKPDFIDEQDNENAEIVIFDDANLGFRQQGDPKLWSKALLNKKTPPWVLVKMCNPIAQGDLWDYLHKNHAEKLIALLTIDDLRFSDVQISRELSWELTAQDLVRELTYNPSVNALSHCAYVIVLFGTDGAILLSRAQVDGTPQKPHIIPKSRVFFDPKGIEGEWVRNYPGGMVGYKTCMAASITHSLLQDPKEPDLFKGMITGLMAMRKLHKEGYRENKSVLLFPIDSIAKQIVKPPKTPAPPFVHCEIRHPAPKSDSGKNDYNHDFWTILGDNYEEWLDGLASRIAIEGVEKVLKKVPRVEFGKLLTVDRREIESFRSIRSLVKEYAETKDEKPLSIAVFGAPGSGKSFGIKEMAKSLLAGQIQELTFNLSQFSSERDLWPALYQVRDVSLTGKLPLVFWDEFDTALGNQPLGWLRYFLAPMQDGKFQDGQITHPIGRAIFVFAGGTSETISKFGSNVELEKRREAKLPDFVSRLKGFINILGPNPIEGGDSPTGIQDNFSVIRRAILLRSILSRDAPHFFHKKTKQLRIDDGVLHALLETGKYKHGARSMESVIAMSLIKNKYSFERSSLPSKAQLDLHVDAEDFTTLVNEVWFSGKNLEKLANQVHKAYQKIFPPAPGGTKTRYKDLLDHDKDQNRDFVHDIIAKLRKCNCSVVQKHRIYPRFKFFDREIEFLAKLEHNRWLKEKIKNNFRYATTEERREARKENPRVRLNDSMLFWDKADESEFSSLLETKKDAVGSKILPDITKENNRIMIRNIPRILSACGYAIVRNEEYMIKIGVTGHRFLAEKEKLTNGIDTAISRIEKAFPGQPIALLSALAEGADRLAADRVLARPGGNLIAALPLSTENYETDFETEESKEEFRRLLGRSSEVVEIKTSAIRDEAYYEGGKYILDNCDVLLAVWDGSTAQGRGGTGEIVQIARERKLPIAWVHAGNRKPGTQEATTLGAKQGTVTFENFAGPQII